MQSVQHTDAFILMEFRDAAKEFIGKVITKENKMAVGVIARPFFDKLVANGNTQREAAWLLQTIVEDKAK